MSVVLFAQNTSRSASRAWWKPRCLVRAAGWWSLVGSLWFRVSSAGAAPELLATLEYEVDEDLEACPSEEEFRRGISEQLGYDPFREEAPHRVLALVEATEHGIGGRLRWEDANGRAEGERFLSSPTHDCAKLVGEMAFAVVVQMQLFNASGPPDSTPPPVAAAVPASEPAAQPEPLPLPHEDAAGPVGSAEAPSQRAAPDSWQLLVGLGPMVAVGSSPKVNGLGRVFGEVRHGAASLEIGAEASLPSTLLRSDGSGFRSSVAMATLAPCLQIRPFSGCVVAKLGAMQTRGLGVDEVRSPSGLLGQAGLRLAVSHEPGRHVVCMLRAETLGTLTRWTVELNHVDVWTIPAVTFLGGIDVAYRF